MSRADGKGIGQYHPRLDPKVYVDGEQRECCGKPTFVSLMHWQGGDPGEVTRNVFCRVSNAIAVHCPDNPSRVPHPWESKPKGSHVHRFVCRCGEAGG